MPACHLTKSILALLASLTFAVALLEAGLRVLTPYPVTRQSNQRDHPRLAYTLSPALADVDDNGFRSTSSPLAEAEVLIIGDSHTYGVNVNAEHSFPSVVERKTGKKVYNFGVGSYGIYQYQVLMEETAVHPARSVILALYPANDLVFECRVLNTEYWKARARSTALTVPNCDKWGPVELAISDTATFQTFSVAWKRIASRFRRRADRDAFFVLDDNQTIRKQIVRTHSANTALDETSVATNFENSKHFLLTASKRLSGLSKELVLLIIPSKERVLHQWMIERERPMPAEFERLLRNERTLVQQYVSFLEHHDIAYVDALSKVVRAFEAALARNQPLYAAGDSHPLQRGYEAYADAAIDGLALVAGAPAQPR